jgi:hypothetical protein
MIIPIWTDVDGKDWEECLSDLNLIDLLIEAYAKQLKNDVFQYLQDQGHQPVPVMPQRMSADVAQFIGNNEILAEAIKVCKEKIKIQNEKDACEAWARHEAWIDGPYKKNCQKARNLGIQARKDGLPRICNITDDPELCHNGTIFRCYADAWCSGWDGFTIPKEFLQVEQNLAKLPTRPMTEEDF